MQLQHILDKSLIADSILKSEVYSFRKGSLVVFFRMYAAKSKLDGMLDLHSKAIINLNAIESVYLEDSVILGRLRDIVRSAFRASKSYLNQAHGDIAIDIDSVKIGNIEQMIEHYFRMEKQSDTESVIAHSNSNVNSHKLASFVTDNKEPSSQEDQSKAVRASHVEGGHPQWLQMSSRMPSTSTARPTTRLVLTPSTPTLHTSQR